MSDNENEVALEADRASKRRALQRLKGRSYIERGWESFPDVSYFTDPAKFDPCPNDRNLDELQPGDLVVGVLCLRHRQMHRAIEDRMINVILLENCEYKCSDPEERRHLAVSLRKMVVKMYAEILAFRMLVEAAFPSRDDEILAVLQIRKNWQVVRCNTMNYGSAIFGPEEQRLGSIGLLSPKPAPKKWAPQPPKRPKGPKLRTAKAEERLTDWLRAGEPKGESHTAWLASIGRPKKPRGKRVLKSAERQHSTMESEVPVAGEGTLSPK